MAVRVTISLAEDLGDFVSKLSAERNMSRSQLFTQLIEEERKRIFEKELAEGYEALAADHQRLAETAIGVANEVWPPY